MAQSSLLGYFDQDFKKKNIIISSNKKTFVDKHKRNLKTKRKLNVQQFLQVGQKQQPQECSICGMMYTKGIKEDEIIHKKFHKEHIQELLLPKWKNIDILWSNNTYTIIQIDKSNSLHQLKKIDIIINRINRELGFNEVFKYNNFFINEQYKVYLCYNKQRYIIGCLVCEPITEGYYYNINNDKINEKTNVLCGISKLWIKSNNNIIVPLLLKQLKKHYITKTQDNIDKNKLSQKDIAISKYLKIEEYIKHIKESNNIIVYS